MEEERVLNLNYDSPSEIRSLLEIMGLGPRKKWSQNFLINRGAREKLVNSINLKKDDNVWEIGPGLGAITRILLDKGVNLTTFEIDPGYIEYLIQSFKDDNNFQIIKGDVVKTWKSVFEQTGKPVGVVGNLPFNAASAIIASFIENNSFPEQMAAIVQSELADRITSKPSTKNYSSFSILCQYSCEVKDLGTLGSGSFYPKPNVSSKIIRMLPHQKYSDLIDQKLFFILVRDCFSSRRKTLQNNLKNAAGRRLQKYGSELLFDAFRDAGIELSTRAEVLTVDQFVSASNRISSLYIENVT
ncbi:MAG: 16S rRNA (adenine(1518)-N(6)/adenine(1519)-N(6))-dimethyltransferase RsmA [Spirochaetaceae bacterium]|jgi:16S rRNA (adenine1518-N6/adenine1519-N6)-dimethyltransferase|nr:16S rRNA (adenine(1518)-N(6)/adenine(1519)-N(6))-dimethyltransferase RsmA [Spirochaetaceae bacterium]